MPFKPSSLCWQETLGPSETPTVHRETWLYGVTLRTARKAKIRLRRQRDKRESDAPGGADGIASVESIAPPADVAAVTREQAEALHSEIERLPGLFRLPVLLCYFEGLTLDEAAHRLQCPPGTLRSRLAQARPVKSSVAD